MDGNAATKTDLFSQRSYFTNQNELNNQRSSITNEKAALRSELQRTDSAGISGCRSVVFLLFTLCAL